MNRRYNPEIHHRRSVRLQNYDYAQAGLYFVTICVKDHECLFGEICTTRRGNACVAPTNGVVEISENDDVPAMILNEMGEIAQNEWLRTAELRPSVVLHNFVVMPNHFHAIIEIVDCGHSGGNCVVPENDDGTTHTAGATHTVGARRALPLHAQHAQHAQYTMPQHQYANELPQSRFQNQGKNTLSAIVGAFKSAVTKNIHQLGLYFAWQRNYHEHVIRNYREYEKIADYIDNNPIRWNTDCFYKNEL